MAISETVHQLFSDFKRDYDSLRREVLYNILNEFGITIKLVRLIKMCLMNPIAQSGYVNIFWHFFLILRTVLGAKLYIYCVHTSMHVRLV